MQDKATLRFRAIDRKQLYFAPVDIENLIDPEHSARAIWEFIGRLNLDMFQQEVRAFEGEAGRSPFQPRLLISLWVYAFSRGIANARQISRLCDCDPAFQWLTGMQTVNHHTLSDFKAKHQEKLNDLFVQILGVLQNEEIIDLSCIFHDGSKIAAAASASSFHRVESIQSKLQLAEKVLQQLESEDPQQQSKRVQASRQRAVTTRKARLEKALQEFEKLPPRTAREHAMRVSTTDPDARNMQMAGGGYAPAFNAQVSTECKNGFIVSVDLSQSASDSTQLQPVPQNIYANTGEQPKQIVVDSGFATKGNIFQMSAQGIEIIGPLKPQASTVEQLQNRGIDPAYGRQAFTFFPESNTYLCPEGKILSHSRTRKGKASLENIYLASKKDCGNCPVKEKCCGKAKMFRRMIVRSEDLPEIKQFKEKMETDWAKQIYKLRSRFAEFPFAWIKDKFGLRRFTLRGKYNALTELIWAALTFNILWYLRIKQSPFSSA